MGEGLDFEAEALQRAAAGDMAARRFVLLLALDALYSGAPLSTDLRRFLADGLAVVRAAVDPGPEPAIKPTEALAVFGFEKNPPHRKAEPGKVEQRLAMAAAVHLLTVPAGSKTKAVGLVTEAMESDPMTVWRACKDQDFTGGDPEAISLVAGSVLRLVAQLVQRAPPPLPLARSPRVPDSDVAPGGRNHATP
ncbi:MAG: hypothetical protein RLZZ182_676 [Pseudomonadota bacterium]